MVIDRGLFATRFEPPTFRPGFTESESWHGMGKGEGPTALWGLIVNLHQIVYGISDECRWIVDYGA